MSENILVLNVVTSEVPAGTLHSADGRPKLILDDLDDQRFFSMSRESRSRPTVTDLTTGARWQVWRASCGLGCRCAAGGRVLS